MQIEQVGAVYFSPTGGTKKGVLAIAKEFSPKPIELDVTVVSQLAVAKEFGANDFVVFGGPVYFGRMYAQFAKRIAGLKGNNTPCVIIATYGNRHYDDGLLELLNLVSSQGFVPIGAGALVAEHTYGEIQKGRPNQQDLEEYIAFAKKVKLKLEQDNLAKVQVPGNFPYKDEGAKAGNFIPLTNDNCNSCGICATTCPEQAISYTDFKTIDGSKCISCFRCLKTCEAKAKNMDVKPYNDFAQMFSGKLATPRPNEFFID